MIPVALTIAGSDPSGGAGIQADLKTFHQLGVYGEAAITLITVQNTTGVRRVELLAPDLVREQIEAATEDIRPDAIKTGALGNAAIVHAVAQALRNVTIPLVVDPVMVSKHGAVLMNDDMHELFPLATLLTPNLHEAAKLTGLAVSTLSEMQRAALRLHEMGARAVLIKGGHLAGDAIDLLSIGGDFEELRAKRIETRHTHGTGCTYSAAITAYLAKGCALPDAVRQAKRFITEAIRTNPGLGAGSGPVSHWV